jgi:hypothetical protein
VKRILMLLTVALLVVALMVATATPALAAKPPPTKEQCQQGHPPGKVKDFRNQGQCIKGSQG